MSKRKSQTTPSSPTADAWSWAREFLSPAEFEAMTAAIESDLKPSIRINQLKADPAKVIEQLKKAYGWEATPIPFCPSGYWINESAHAPSKTIEHRMGYYYIQEAASMLPGELFDLEGIPQPLILDMAASPGGKTIHLVDRTQDEGLVIANDGSRSRITALRIVLQNWGAINQAVSNLGGEWFGSAYPETFDAALLDAPCSMQGLRTSASHSMRPISENEILALSERQFRLLESALRTVKVGGQVVYSTCTLSPLENEAVVSRILKTYGDAAQLEDIQKRLPSPAPAAVMFGDMIFDAHITRAARLWPHVYGTAGFFCAKFIKTGSILKEKEDTHWGGSSARLRGAFLTDAASRTLSEQIQSQYGFDLKAVMEKLQLIFQEENDGIYLIPIKAATRLPELPISSMGMLAGKAYPNGWQPSHAFVSRFGDQFTQQVYTLEDDHLAAWQRGEDIRDLGDGGALAGKILAVRDKNGRNLGRGKMLANRLKNMLPTRLF